MTKTVSDQKHFSAIKLFPLLEKEIAKLNTYPLSKDNFIIQQDVFKRLGSLGYDSLEEQEEAYEVFAVLEASRKEKDTDLRFAMELNALGLIMNIEGVGEIFFKYDECFKDEKSAATQIIAFLKMLANGQLACLITSRHGKPCASEFIVFEKDKRVPAVVMTDGDYGRFWKKDDETGYESQVLRNHYLKDQISLPKELFFIDYDEKGKLLQKGRIFKNGDLTPLTKKAYSEALEQIGNRLMGQKPDEDEWGVLSRSWEFWVLSVVVGAGIFFASLNGYIPGFFSEVPFIIAPIATTIGAFLATHVIIRKNNFKNTNPDSKVLKLGAGIGEAISKRSYAVGGAFIAALLFVTNFMPIYVLRESGHIVSLWEVAKIYSPAYIAPVLFLAGFYLSFTKKKLASVLYFLCITLGVVLLFFVNMTKTNADADTPGLYTAIAVISYLVTPVIAFFMMLARLRNPAEDAMNTYVELDSDTEVEQVSAEDIKKGVQKLKRVLRTQMIFGYLAGAALIVAGYLYKDIPDKSLVFNDHRFLVAGVAFAGFLTLLSVVLLYKKVISQTLYGWLAYVIMFAILITLSQGIRDGADEGSDLAWILVFVAAFGQVIISNIAESTSDKFGGSDVNTAINEENKTVK